MGSILAYSSESFSSVIATFAIITTIFLQVLSNLANDYGDSKKGTDNMERIGPERAVQSGIISLREMKIGIVITSLFALISGIFLIYYSLHDIDIAYLLGFFILGIGAIAAAIKYTVGKNPYGYAGLGDLFVFIFFGIVGVIGTYFLHTHEIGIVLLLPAASIGFLSTAVLNMNNMRDIENDAKCNKKTLVVKLGIEKAKIYHTLLILLTILSFTSFIFINSSNKASHFLLLLPVIILLLNLKKVWTFKKNQELDSELKKIALSALLLAILFGVCQFI